MTSVKPAIGKIHPIASKRLAAHQNSDKTTDTAPEENSQPSITDTASVDTPVDTPVESTNAIDSGTQEAMVSYPDEQISSMPAASVGLSGTTWGVLAGGLGLAAAGGGGGGQSAPALRLTIDKIATDEVMGPTEKDTTTIQGSTLAGATVQIKFGDRTRAATVEGTKWRYLITAQDIATMGQGDETITVVASLTDGTTVTLTRSIKILSLEGIVDIGVSSAQGIQNDTLNAKDVVFIMVKMSEAYTVAGTPQLNINIDGKATVANYVSGSGSASLVFSYTIVDGQNDAKGISIEAGALMLNGGSLLNANGKPPESLSYGSVGSNAKYLVDTSAPTLTNLSYKVPENTTVVANLKGSDASAITYSLAGTSGDDSHLFLLTEGGALTLKAPADFETLGKTSTDPSYKLVVNMTDVAGNVSQQTLTVQVTDVNEAPVITSAAAVGFSENGTGIAYQASAKDDDTGAVLTYSINDTDAALFNVNANTGAITFKMTPNFENPDDAGADNVYNFTLAVSDGTLKTTKEVAITVANGTDTNFKLNFLSNFATEAQIGFKKAASFWSSVLSDDVLINLNLGYTSDNFTANTIGSTFSDRLTKTYAEVRNALVKDAKSSTDDEAVNSLKTSSSFDMLLNLTLNNPLGEKSSSAYKDGDGDANNQLIDITRSNAKALGLLPQYNTASDATIVFNSAFNFDFDRSNGIEAGKFDFIGVAIHEIGHALGFTSGVNVLDDGQFGNDDSYTYVTPIDLFRYSELSTQQGVIDWTAGTSDKYFSLDNGVTKIASFSTGVKFGDGRQTSHWKDNQGIGGLDPTLNRGELLNYTSIDQMGFDAIGWDLTSFGDNLSAPKITSLSNVNFVDRSRATAYTVVATDNDPWNKLSFALSGTDANLFSINARTGVVKFIAEPKYEAPTDSNANNIYQISVTASDGFYTSAAKSVDIHVIQASQNINDFMSTNNNVNHLTNAYHVL